MLTAPPATYENAKVAHWLARAMCGCMTKDCSLHGAYVAGEFEEARELAAAHVYHPPELITVDGRQPTWQDFERLAKSDALLKTALDGYKLGGYQSREHMLICLAVQQSGAIRELIEQWRKVPPSPVAPQANKSLGDEVWLVQRLVQLIEAGHPAITDAKQWDLTHNMSTFLRRTVNYVLDVCRRAGLDPRWQLDVRPDTGEFLGVVHDRQSKILAVSLAEATSAAAAPGGNLASRISAIVFLLYEYYPTACTADDWQEVYDGGDPARAAIDYLIQCQAKLQSRLITEIRFDALGGFVVDMAMAIAEEEARLARQDAGIAGLPDDEDDEADGYLGYADDGGDRQARIGEAVQALRRLADSEYAHEDDEHGEFAFDDLNPSELDGED